MPEDPDVTKPWPHFLRRHLLQDDEETFNDLMWSVGGSPPYGGVSYEEAAAVYELLESFTGQGMATPDKYEAVREFLGEHPEREAMLDLFQCYDEIVSNAEGYSMDSANRGLAIAEGMEDPALIGLFQLFQAGVFNREGKLADAAARTVDGLRSLLDAASTEPAAEHRVTQAAQNAVALTALAGDLPGAKQLLDDLAEVLPADASAQLRRWLESQR